MLNDKQKEKLKNQWGDKADALACFAQVRVYDSLSDWQCYIFAVNPENENEIQCLISGGKNLEPIVTPWSMYELSLLYNSNGDGVLVDYDFRPREVAIILKKLNETGAYER